jgi:hypothetical protein
MSDSEVSYVEMSDSEVPGCQLSEGVYMERIAGPIYDKFKSNLKALKSGFVRFQPYNQVPLIRPGTRVARKKSPKM